MLCILFFIKNLIWQNEPDGEYRLKIGRLISNF